jgi:hypothetical protein
VTTPGQEPDAVLSEVASTAETQAAPETPAEAGESAREHVDTSWVRTEVVFGRQAPVHLSIDEDADRDRGHRQTYVELQRRRDAEAGIKAPGRHRAP